MSNQGDHNMNVFIANFNNSRDFNDIKQSYDDYKGTNLDFILEDFSIGNTKWSVPKTAIPGDIILFMCAKEARHNLGMAVSNIQKSFDSDFTQFIDEQKNLYKQYSGRILGYGIVQSIPEKDQTWWMADIDHLVQFSNTIASDDFKSFISISRTDSITFLTDTQWERLKWVINQKNPSIFPNVLPPDKSILDEEFEDEVRKVSKKPMEELQKIAKKKESAGITSVLQVKTYHRDATIAAYVKKRANGRCQLCGLPAPFKDQNNEPYLECHHIEWLSKGGVDSIDNCVALCPNCHKRMHILNSENDVALLKNLINHD